jgi:hypothetical protein
MSNLPFSWNPQEEFDCVPQPPEVWD